MNIITDKEVFQNLSLLGKRVEDMVTGASGVVTSVTFDLYGCIQALVNPSMKDDGTMAELFWFDVNRLAIIDDIPVMTPPNFASVDSIPIPEGFTGFIGAKGPESNKPTNFKAV